MAGDARCRLAVWMFAADALCKTTGAATLGLAAAFASRRRSQIAVGTLTSAADACPNIAINSAANTAQQVSIRQDDSSQQHCQQSAGVTQLQPSMTPISADTSPQVPI